MVSLVSLLLFFDLVSASFTLGIYQKIVQALLYLWSKNSFTMLRSCSKTNLEAVWPSFSGCFWTLKA